MADSVLKKLDELVELTFDLTASALCVEGATSVAASADVVIDPMTDRLLSVVATTHRWDVQDGRATGRIARARDRLGCSLSTWSAAF